MPVSNPNRLNSAGPIDPTNGFPIWFSDGTNRLEIVLNEDPNAPAIGELPNPAQPMAFPGNFPDEAFYFMAEARLTVGGNGIQARARVIFALEAAFGGAGEPAVGGNVVFARIRVRMDDLIPGEKYSVYHPYGEFIDLEADDRGRVFHTADLGIVEGNPTAVLRTGQVAPFLVGTTAIPVGYIGDGATEQQVTGGPFRNTVIIQGPRIREEGGREDPAHIGDINYVFTDLFTVQGRRATRVGAVPESATYEVSGGQTRIRVAAKSDVGQDIRLVGDQFHFKLEGNGPYYSVIGDIAQVPAGGMLVNVTDNPPTSAALPVSATGKLTDFVTVSSAVHDRDTDTFTIDVRSSDPAAILKIEALGLTLEQGPNSFPGLVVVPGVVEVISDKGGSASQPVDLRGASATPATVEAKIALQAGQYTDEPITLDGSLSPGATGHNWAKQSGPNAVIASSGNAVTTVQLSAAGTYVFALTVSGQGGPATTTVSVTVAAPPANDGLAISLCEYRTGRQQFRIAGTVGITPNHITVMRSGTTVGAAAPDATGAFAIRTSLAEIGGAPPQPGDTLQIVSQRSTVTFPISIRN